MRNAVTTSPCVDISIGKDALGWWAACSACGEIASRQPDRAAAREKAADHIDHGSEGN